MRKIAKPARVYVKIAGGLLLLYFVLMLIPVLFMGGGHIPDWNLELFLTFGYPAVALLLFCTAFLSLRFAMIALGASLIARYAMQNVFAYRAGARIPFNPLTQDLLPEILCVAAVALLVVAYRVDRNYQEWWRPENADEFE